MCTFCFEQEYPKMTYEEFEAFQHEFDTKIEKSIYFVKNEKYKFDFHTIYNCKYCNVNWWLSDPDNHRYGYFLKENNAKKAIDKDEKNGNLIKFGCLGIILICILIVMFF